MIFIFGVPLAQGDSYLLEWTEKKWKHSLCRKKIAQSNKLLKKIFKMKNEMKQKKDNQYGLFGLLSVPRESRFKHCVQAVDNEQNMKQNSFGAEGKIFVALEHYFSIYNSEEPDFESFCRYKIFNENTSITYKRYIHQLGSIAEKVVSLDTDRRFKLCTFSAGFSELNLELTYLASDYEIKWNRGFESEYNCFKISFVDHHSTKSYALGRAPASLDPVSSYSSCIKKNQ
ncbi:MAG: hypothetical protein HOE90_19365 [Bacteriovoracaceae bacterium]|jgi:hypothetical protein|nr:hypothetical protein [Bacteriovoracaceae bacterium]